MKARLLVGVVVMSSMVVSAVSAVHAEDVNVKRENGIYYLEVSGTPYECGVQHGKALKSEIQKSVSDYKANVVKMFGKENGAKILDWALNQAKFKKDLDKHVPDLVAEARGIAEGAGVTLDDILMLGMYEEVYEAGPHKIGLHADPKKSLGQGCSAFTIRSAVGTATPLT